MSIAVPLFVWALSVVPITPAGWSQGPGSARERAEDPQEGANPIWAKSFEDAKARAELQQRLVLLVFLGESCPACPLLEDHVFKDPRIVDWMERHVIALRLFDDKDLAERYSVGSVPSILLLDSGLKEIDRVSGYLEPPALVTALLDIYEGRGGLTRAQRELAAKPEDPDAHLALARVLFLRGRGDDAVEHFLWAFDHLRGNPQRQDERLGVILGELKVLQRSQVSAARGLRERRDRDAALLIEAYDPETPIDELLLSARELVLLNGALSNVSHTFFAWDTLRKREGMPPEVVAVLFDSSVQGRLLQEKRYQDYLDAAGDPLVLLEASLAELQVTQSALVESGKTELEVANAGNGIAFAATWYYEALMGVGRAEDANAVVELLLALEPSAQAYLSMVSVVFRFGGKEQASALQERGLAGLPEGSEKKRFERVTRKLLHGTKR